MEHYLINFLKELKQYGIVNDIPNVSERGGRFLNMLVKITGSKSVLEIGSANGYSTIWLADAVCKNDGKVTSIDFSRPSLDAAKDNLAEVGLHKHVDFHFGDAFKVLPKIKKPAVFDFIFIDGEKRRYWDFWELVSDRLSESALVVFDDVISFPEKTDAFMKKIKAVIGFDHLVLPINQRDGILLLYRIN